MKVRLLYFFQKSDFAQPFRQLLVAEWHKDETVEGIDSFVLL